MTQKSLTQERLDKEFIEAAKKGNIAAVKKALGQDADIHADDDIALRLAAENGHWETVKYLVERGADYKGTSTQNFGFFIFWSQEKLRELFNLDFMVSHLAAAQHFWNILSDEQRTASLRKHYKMNNYLALQHLRKGNKPRRLVQPEQRKVGATPS